MRVDLIEKINPKSKNIENIRYEFQNSLYIFNIFLTFRF